MIIHVFLNTKNQTLSKIQLTTLSLKITNYHKKEEIEGCTSSNTQTINTKYSQKIKMQQSTSYKNKYNAQNQKSRF